MFGLLLPVVVVGALTLPPGLSLEDKVEMAGGLDFVGATAPEELHWGDTATVTLWFHSRRPIQPGVWNFLHIESRETACRIVEDHAPAAAVDGLVAHDVRITIPKDGPCAESQRLDIFTGMYHREGNGARIRVLNPPGKADRIYAGYIELVSGEPNTALVAFPPSDLAEHETESELRPWWGWIWGVLIATVLAALLRWLIRLRKQTLPAPAPLDWAPEDKRRRRLMWLGVAAILVVPFMLSVLAALDFIKDDAYISFRYAQNVVAGNGLVFNSGEYLEGITNFLWTLLMIPFEALGWDLFQVSEVLGVVMSLGFIYYMTRITVRFEGGEKHLAWLWAGLWIATSSSLGRWSTSGLEQPLAMLLPVASAWFLWRSWRDPVPAPEHRRDMLKSGILMGLGCMTRPELHLIAFLVGLPLVVRFVYRAWAQRRLDREAIWWFVGLFAIVVPFHLFRYAYYGSLVPNTFYVKTSDSTLVIQSGLKKLSEMLDFNQLGYVVLLTPFAFVTRRRLTEKLVMLAISLAFMAYIVKVGTDEMSWHRLYLPALPFLVMLAGLGLMNLARMLTRLAKDGLPAKVLVYGAGWVVVVVAAAASFSFTYSQMGGFNGRGDLSGNYHPDMGKFLTRHERAGALVAFQDMGSTPYHAPDINFLDFIGLVDGTVARARYDYGLHAFLATEAQRNKGKYDADMREYFYRRNPEWAILTTYVPGGATGKVSEKFAKDPGPEALYPYIAQNGYQFGIYNAEFKRRYVHVRTWPRSAGYYLSLFRRKDLWDQTPGEVVLDAPPANLGGVKAKFEGGLELLGSEMQASVTQRQGFFLTTWWRVPGPMAKDLFFFNHIEAESYRLPYDSLPGDWMYPADRWQPGQIIENRALIETPPGMKTGDYQVFMGAYYRGSGERLKVVEGPNDGQNRLDMGTLEVTPLIPPFHQLIDPCRPDEMRHHPERIIDSHRAPGT
ncbi:MAG: hypothetical protein EP329_02580 [Deltaproteobacteria bacterium]|nr:MAG: hypothetical protein EP329_02580 [Deltaproteobacteria bacterium]